MQRLAIYGAGGFGTALALATRRAGRDVTLIARNPQAAEEMVRLHENRAHLPGILVDPSIKVTAELKAIAKADLAILAVPAQSVRPAASVLAAHLKRGAPVVLVSKGIEQNSGLMTGEVLAEILPSVPHAVLSGPSFANEIGIGLPTAVTLASRDQTLANVLAKALGSPAFRVYVSTDTVGVELGGAVKNVIAIACGIAMGRGLGENARAALMTRGLAEMARLGASLGAQPQTFMGLSGIGDLALTSTSSASRNYSLGVALGRGRSLTEATMQGRVLAEGAFTAPAVLARAERARVEMPIASAVDAVLHKGAAVEDAVRDLLARPFGVELPSH